MGVDRGMCCSSTRSSGKSGEAARLEWMAKTGGVGRGQMTASPTLIDLVDLHMGSVSESVLEVVDLVTMADPLNWDI